MPPSAGKCRVLLRACWGGEAARKNRAAALPDTRAATAAAAVVRGTTTRAAAIAPAASAAYTIRKQQKKDPRLLTPSHTKFLRLSDLPATAVSRCLHDHRRIKSFSNSDLDFLQDFTLPAHAQQQQKPKLRLQGAPPLPEDLLMVSGSPGTRAAAREAAALSFWTCSAKRPESTESNNNSHRPSPLYSNSGSNGSRRNEESCSSSGRHRLQRPARIKKKTVTRPEAKMFSSVFESPTENTQTLAPETSETPLLVLEPPTESGIAVPLPQSTSRSSASEISECTSKTLVAMVLPKRSTVNQVAMVPGSLLSENLVAEVSEPPPSPHHKSGGVVSVFSSALDEPVKSVVITSPRDSLKSLSESPLDGLVVVGPMASKAVSENLIAGVLESPPKSGVSIPQCDSTSEALIPEFDAENASSQNGPLVLEPASERRMSVVQSPMGVRKLLPESTAVTVAKADEEFLATERPLTPRARPSKQQLSRCGNGSTTKSTASVSGNSNSGSARVAPRFPRVDAGIACSERTKEFIRQRETAIRVKQCLRSGRLMDQYVNRLLCVSHEQREDRDDVYVQLSQLAAETGFVLDKASAATELLRRRAAALAAAKTIPSSSPLHICNSSASHSSAAVSASSASVSFPSYAFVSTSTGGAPVCRFAPRHRSVTSATSSVSWPSSSSSTIAVAANGQEVLQFLRATAASHASKRRDSKTLRKRVNTSSTPSTCYRESDTVADSQKNVTSKSRGDRSKRVMNELPDRQQLQEVYRDYVSIEKANSPSPFAYDISPAW